VEEGLRWELLQEGAGSSRQARSSADGLWTPEVSATSSGRVRCAQTNPIEYRQVQKRREESRVGYSRRIRGRGGSRCEKSAVAGAGPNRTCVQSGLGLALSINPENSRGEHVVRSRLREDVLDVTQPELAWRWGSDSSLGVPTKGVDFIPGE